MSPHEEPLVLAALLVVLGCSDGTKYIGSNPGSSECVAPAPPPAALELDAFYAKYLDARGVPVASSANVSATALERACETATHVLGKYADVRRAMKDNGFLVAVIGVDEVLTDLPQHEDLYEIYPGVDWDYTVRSLGASRDRPVSSVGEENLLCLDEDLYVGESIAIHSIAHGLRGLGIAEVDPDWDVRLRAAYDAALSAGLWTDTFAATEPSQYFAEGVQSFYDANLDPPNALHNEIDTRSELERYDPELASLISEYVPTDDWRPACPAGP